MLYRFIFIITLFSIFACNSNTGKNTQNDKPASESVPLKTTEDAVVNKNFYKRLDGKIAGKDVVVHISRFEDETFVNYYYVSEGMPIDLFLNNEAKLKGDSIELFEYSRLEKSNEKEQDDKWHIVLTGNGASGKWISGDGKTVHDINLKENYPAGSHLFNIVGASGNYPVYFKNDTATATSYMMVMEPADAATNNWYRKAFIKNILGENEETSSSLQQILDKETADYLAGYKDEIDTMRMNGDLNDTDTHYMLNYDNRIFTNALFNDKDYLVLDVGTYAYTGGAHGMNSTSVICYNMKEKKEMQLTDVVNIDSATLQGLVEKHFRLQSGLKPGQNMRDILFENTLPANDNFYFTNNGLGFIYQPYEVAAYAMGIINVFIPYNELKPYINQQFAQQMGIE